MTAPLACIARCVACICLTQHAFSGLSFFNFLLSVAFAVTELQLAVLSLYTQHMPPSIRAVIPCPFCRKRTRSCFTPLPLSESAKFLGSWHTCSTRGPAKLPVCPSFILACFCQHCFSQSIVIGQFSQLRLGTTSRATPR